MRQGAAALIVAGAALASSPALADRPRLAAELAERYVNDALLTLDDDALKAYGYTRGALKHRRGGRFYL